MASDGDMAVFAGEKLLQCESDRVHPVPGMYQIYRCTRTAVRRQVISRMTIFSSLVLRLTKVMVMKGRWNRVLKRSPG